MKSFPLHLRRRVLHTVTAMLAIGMLAACASPASAPPAETTPTQVREPDANGLFDGKTRAQASGEMRFKCMQDAGWTQLVLDPDGSISGHVPIEQNDKYYEDEAACVAEMEKVYPLVPMSDRAIRERYGDELKTRECLIAQGYDISEPPSEQAYVEWFTGITDDLWDPYWEVISETNTSEADLVALKQKCPDPAARHYAE